jgi:hypothetical protein
MPILLWIRAWMEPESSKVCLMFRIGFSLLERVECRAATKLSQKFFHFALAKL